MKDITCTDKYKARAVHDILSKQRCVTKIANERRPAKVQNQTILVHHHPAETEH